MNRLQYILTAKTQYNIQSPFLFELYNEVLNSRLSRDEKARLGIAAGDKYGELRYMIGDYYGASSLDVDTWDVDDLMSSHDGLIGMVRLPHRDCQSEERWHRLTQKKEVTLSVDLFDIGLIFTCNRLSKENVILRCV